ncbi:hypothetical protein M433DRAFT_160449, partial [Acidomyces richmondensis BFW]
YASSTDQLPTPATKDESIIAILDRNLPVFAMNTIPIVMMPLPFLRSPEAPHFTSNNIISFLYNYKRISLRYGYPDDRAVILMEDYCDEGYLGTIEALTQYVEEVLRRGQVDTIQYSRAFNRIIRK